MDKTRPCLWFDEQAEQAAELYVSLFDNSRITGVSHYSDAGPRPAGSVLTVDFELDGRPFTALNGGPMFTFTEAVSFQIHCADQAEVDHFWDGLLAGGGEPGQCGWLKDRYGVSWQVIPTALMELMGGGDAEVSQRVATAMFAMSKLDVAALQAAAAG